MKKNAVWQQQINSETCAVVNTGIFAITNTWSYVFLFQSKHYEKTSSFDQNLDITVQKSVTHDRNTDINPACVTLRNSWLLNEDITLNLQTADWNLFNNGHFAYNYEWKCKNNVSMKSNYLICWTQHHISIETV